MALLQEPVLAPDPLLPAAASSATNSTDGLDISFAPSASTGWGKRTLSKRSPATALGDIDALKLSPYLLPSATKSHRHGHGPLSPGDAQFAAAVHTVASDAIGDDEMLAALGRWAMSNAGLSPLTPPTPVQGGATTTKSSLE